MMHKRLETRKAMRAQPIKDGAGVAPTAGDHPVTNHQSFSHAVMYTGAHAWRAATAGLLHGRSHTDPTVKPHQHKNLDPNWHLGRGEKLR